MLDATLINAELKGSTPNRGAGGCYAPAAIGPRSKADSSVAQLIEATAAFDPLLGD